MIQTITEMMSFTFIQRAVLVGTLVSLCAALLGVSLVLKRYSMIGDGLSHVGFGVLTIATSVRNNFSIIYCNSYCNNFGSYTFENRK